MNESNNNLIIPGAIVIAGLIIAGAIVFNNGGINSGGVDGNTTAAAQVAGGSAEPRQINQDDHIVGNVDAKVVIVEYSDTECPFCKRFHETLQQVVDSYGPDEVAWVYRHFPIPQLHSKAEREAVATECAAKLGGNDAFWAYTNQIYKITPSNDGLDLALLPEIAVEVGLNRNDFETCLDDESVLEKVQADRAEAIATGGRGTPHSIILSEGEVITSIPGAQGFEQIKIVIDQILGEE